MKKIPEAVENFGNIKDNLAFWERAARRYDGFTRRFCREYPDLIEKIIADIDDANRVLEVATRTGLIALKAAAAVCANALHVMEHPERALAEIKRVLRPGGKLIAATYCHGESLRSRIVSGLISLSGFKVYHRLTVAGFHSLIESGGFSIKKEDVFKSTPTLSYVVASF